jgi:GxxExxY protein
MEKKTFDPAKYPLQQETDLILRKAIDIHKTLGAGFLEIVYKDAFEYENQTHGVPYDREKEYLIHYKKTILPHRFYADFVMFGKVIVEIKAKAGGIAEEDYARTLNYLKCSGCKVGLILNFAKMKLEVKRVVF